MSLDGEWDFKYFDNAASFAADHGEWSKIAVPSNWEMKGFGKLSYGSEKAKNVSEESGLYRRTFKTPDDFAAGSMASLRFEGVMFGAEVTVNGRPAGSFRSSFNRNTLDVSTLLKRQARRMNSSSIRSSSRRARFSTRTTTGRSTAYSALCFSMSARRCI